MKKKKAFLLSSAAVMMFAFSPLAQAKPIEQMPIDGVKKPKCNQQGYCQGRP